MILPAALAVGVEAEGNEASRYAWAVNPDHAGIRLQHALGLPYPAHFAAPTGEYLYACQPSFPGTKHEFVMKSTREGGVVIWLKSI